MRKKIDARIRTLVENCVKLRQRGLFIIVGDKGRDQVGNNPHCMPTQLCALHAAFRAPLLWSFWSQHSI